MCPPGCHHNGLYTHITNFKEPTLRNVTVTISPPFALETELSKYIWTLQDSKKPFQIKWKVLKKCKPYSNIRRNVIFNVFMKSSSSFVK